MGERGWGRFSAGRGLFWLGIIPIAYRFGWLASVTFVAACSIYANAASDLAAWRADRNQELKKRLDRIEQLLVRICDQGGSDGHRH